VRLQREEFAAYGSALLAGHGIGLFSDLAATAERFTEVKDRFLPREEIHNAYLPLVDLYRRVLEAVEDFSYQLLEFASGGRDDGKGSGHG
jgi:sugar (pentulose or hexulose) kinase